jgi:hypothetical protein
MIHCIRQAEILDGIEKKHTFIMLFFRCLFLLFLFSLARKTYSEERRCFTKNYKDEQHGPLHKNRVNFS